MALIKLIHKKNNKCCLLLWSTVVNSFSVTDFVSVSESGQDFLLACRLCLPHACPFYEMYFSFAWILEIFSSLIFIYKVLGEFVWFQWVLVPKNCLSASSEQKIAFHPLETTTGSPPTRIFHIYFYLFLLAILKKNQIIFIIL